MHPDKGYRSVHTDVLTDSETIYEAYVRTTPKFVPPNSEPIGSMCIAQDIR